MNESKEVTKKEAMSGRQNRTIMLSTLPEAPPSIMENKKKERPKTAKVFIREPRRTGLEDEAKPTVKYVQGRRSSDPKKPPFKASPKQLLYNPVDSILQDIEVPKSKAPSTPSTDSIPEAKEEKKVVEKVVPKRALMSDNSFMDAMNAAVTVKKPKIVRKKLGDVSKPPSQENERRQSLDAPPQSLSAHSSSSSITNDTSMTVGGKRKIHFADDKGMDLVAIRYFEIEEGERINVVRLTPEQRQQEGFFLKQHMSMSYNEDDDSSEVMKPKKKNVKAEYRLIQLNNLPEVDIDPGSKSIAKHEEKRRQETVMEVFYFGRAIDITDELSPEQAVQDKSHEITVIPLDPVVDPADESAIINDMIMADHPMVSLAPISNVPMSNMPSNISSFTSSVVQDMPTSSIPAASHTSPEKFDQSPKLEVENKLNIAITPELKNLLASINLKKANEPVEEKPAILEPNKINLASIDFSRLSGILEKVKSGATKPSDVNQVQDTPSTAITEASYESDGARRRSRFDSGTDGQLISTAILPPPQVHIPPLPTSQLHIPNIPPPGQISLPNLPNPALFQNFPTTSVNLMPQNRPQLGLNTANNIAYGNTVNTKAFIQPGFSHGQAGFNQTATNNNADGSGYKPFQTNVVQCKYFARGNCGHGERCRFAHGDKMPSVQTNNFRGRGRDTRGGLTTRASNDTWISTQKAQNSEEQRDQTKDNERNYDVDRSNRGYRRDNTSYKRDNNRYDSRRGGRNDRRRYDISPVRNRRDRRDDSPRRGKRHRSWSRSRSRSRSRSSSSSRSPKRRSQSPKRDEPRGCNRDQDQRNSPNSSNDNNETTDEPAQDQDFRMMLNTA